MTAPELVALGMAWAVLGCRVAVSRDHFTLSPLAFCAVFWPAVLWLAFCEWVQESNGEEERP